MANSEPIHFFDITCDLSGPLKSWSPNTLKTRVALNFKGIPYTQSFISMPDIAPLVKSLNLPPHSQGLLQYTLPAIVHKTSISTNPAGAMNDSLPIALHLDETFPAPQYPALFPSGDASYALVLAVEKIFWPGLYKAFPLLMPNLPEILDDKAKPYFHETREKWFGKPVAELRPKNEEAAQSLRKEVKEELSVLGQMLKGKKGKEGPFLEGSKPGYADLVLVAGLRFFEIVDKETFEVLLDIGDGAFRKLWDACLPWVNGQGEDKEWAGSSL